MAGSIKKYVGKGGKISWNVRVRKGKNLITGTFPTKRMAEDFIAVKESEIVQEKYFPQSQKPIQHTVADLIDVYVERVVNHHTQGTKVAYLHCLKYWRSALGDTLVTNVTPALLENCKYYLLNTKGFDPQTVNKYLASISPAFTLAASPALNWITKNPFSELKKLKEPPGRAPQLSDQQIQALLDWCDRSRSPHLWLFARLVLATGARKNEALTARWGQVNFTRKSISYLQTKGRKPKTVPLPSRLVQILKDEYDRRFGEDAGLMNDPTNYCLFPSPTDPCKPAQNLHLSWNKARTKAGLATYRIHDMRHSAASNFITKGGADILAVSQLLGHSDVRQSARYAHLTSSHLADIVERTEQKG